MKTLLENEHSAMVQALAKPGHAIWSDMTDTDAHLLHMVVGVSGEAGELLDAIKKAVIYRKSLDYANVVEELGDIEFYLEGIRSCLGISRDDTILENIIKLKRRYPADEYQDHAARDRADKGPA